MVHCGRLGGQRLPAGGSLAGEGRDLVGQLGEFAGEAPVPELREELGYGPVRRGSKIVPSLPLRKFSRRTIGSVAFLRLWRKLWG